MRDSARFAGSKPRSLFCGAYRCASSQTSRIGIWRSLQRAMSSVMRAITDTTTLMTSDGIPDRSMIEIGLDRTSVVSGKCVTVRVDLGGRRIIKQKQRYNKPTHANQERRT